MPQLLLYSSYVWGAFGLTGLCLIIFAWLSWKQYKNQEKKFHLLKQSLNNRSLK